MRIAAAYIDGNIAPFFSRVSALKIYEIENGRVITAKLLETHGVGYGALALALNQLNIEAVICGRISLQAKSALTALDIDVVNGTAGNADDALDAYLEHTLEPDSDMMLEEETEHICSPSMCAGCSSQSCGG